MQRIKAMLLRRQCLALAATTLGVLGFTGAANAATYTVNDTTDAPLATSSDTNCVSTNGGSCTLRAAVQAADNTGGANTINLPAGTYTLSIPPSCTSNSSGCDARDPSKGDLDVNSSDNGTSITISGAGSGSSVINANSVDRAFDVWSSSTTGALSLSGLTVENGTPAFVGGYYLSRGNGSGGAIYGDGTISLTNDVTLTHNSAPSSDGGAIYVPCCSGGRPLTIVNSSLTNNTATDEGGAVYYYDYSTLTVTGDTFSGNSAPYQGGALVDWNSSSGRINNDTFK